MSPIKPGSIFYELANTKNDAPQPATQTPGQATSKPGSIFYELANKEQAQADNGAPTAENPKPLPPGATEYLANGEAYYGPGLQGWWKGVQARLSEPAYQRNEDGTYSQTNIRPLQYGARLLQEGTGAVLGAVSQVQEGFQAGLSVPQTLEDIADKSNSFLPDINKGLAADNWVYNLAGPSTIGAIYNSARILTGSRKMPWEDVVKTAKGNAVLASRLGGSQTPLAQYANKASIALTGQGLFNANLREEFLRRYNGGQGESADKLVAEMANPIVEMGYDMIVDPFNLVGGFVDDAMKAAKTAKATKLFETVPELADGWAALKLSTSTTVEVSPIVADMTAKIITRNTAAETALLDTKAAINPWRLNARGRADQAADVTTDMFRLFIGTFQKKPDELGEALRALTLVGSKEQAQVAEGLKIWRSLNPGIGELATSEPGLQAAQLMNRMFTDEAGNLTGKYFEDVAKAASKGNLPAVLEKWDSLANKTLREMYPTVLEMAEKPGMYKVPEWAIKVARANEFAQTHGVQQINKFFSDYYITLNPGVSGRNLINNVFTAAVDHGPEVGSLTLQGLKQGENPVIDKIDEMLGFVNRAATRGGGPIEGQSLIKKMRGLTDKTEQATSAAIVYSVVKRELGRVMKEGSAIADATPLRDLGMSAEQVDRLIGLVKSHNGDVERALGKWFGENSSGVIDTFRDVRAVMNPVDIKAARATPGLMEGVEKVLNAPTEKEALAEINKIREHWQELAQKPDGLIPSIFDGDPIGNELVEATLDNGLSEEQANLFNVRLRVQRKVTNVLSETVEKIFDNVNITNGVDELARSSIGTARTALRAERGTIYEAVTKANDAFRESVIGVVKDPQNMRDLARMERQAKAAIDGFSDYLLKPKVTEKGMVNAIWTYFFEEKNKLWNGELESLMKMCEKHLGNLSNLAGRNLLEDDLFKLAKEQVDDAFKVMQAEKVTKDGIWVNGVKMLLNSGKPKDAIRRMAQVELGIASKTGVENVDPAIINIINANLPAGAQRIASLDEIGQTLTVEEAQAAIKAHIAKHAAPITPAADTAGLERITFDVFDTLMPSSGQAARGNLNGVNALLDRLEAGIRTQWGRGKAVPDITVEQMAAVKAWKLETDARVTKARAVISRIAQQERDFALLNYGQKTKLDNALAYLFPYQFWYSRSYANWMGRLVQHPEVISRYAAYKEFLAQEHANLQDWWKYNVSINDLPGVNVENPMYMNLEATLNPLNGIMGIDFTDKNKVVGAPGTFEYFWTSALDDVNKFGPSTWTPLTMSTAMYLYLQGERDAAARWAGRLIPQTAPIKAAGALAGANFEIDPMVLLMSGKGLNSYDPYEARRIGRAMYAMAKDGAVVDGQVVTPEKAIEAMRQQDGPIFNQALLRATQDRALGGTLTSFFFGVGYKQRSKADMEIDKFYEDYNALWQNADQLSPQEFKVAMDVIREKYPFMDTVLLSKQGGVERDRAYAYTIMSRVAPGDVAALTKAAGLPDGIMDKFYSEKGNIGAWKQDDRMKFMGGMIAIGTTLAIPPNATQQEWTKARNAYRTVNDQIAARLGADIWEKVDVYFEKRKKSEDEANAYLKLNPKVGQAMDYKSYAVANSPILAAYYDGLGNIENYYKGEMQKDVLDKLGADYYDIQAARTQILDPKELAIFDRENNLKAKQKQYTALATKWNNYIDRQLLDYGNHLPEGTASVTQDLSGQTLSTGQQAIVNALATPPKVQWSEIQPVAPAMLTTALEKYFNAGRPLTTAEKSVRTRTANALNITVDELMQAASAAMQ